MSSASNGARRLEAVAVAPAAAATAAVAPATTTPARKPRQTPERLCRVLTLMALGFLVPLIRIAYGEEPRAQLKELGRTLGVPIIAMLLFVLLWSFAASRIQTSLGQIPGPAAVWQQAGA